MPESPKERFLQTQHAKVVAEMVTTPALITALDAVLLQLSFEQGFADTFEKSAMNQQQSIGALKFRNMLLHIATPPKPQPKLRGDNLPHSL